MEMINKAAYADLKEAGMDNEKAVAIASHIPDWTQFTTRQGLLCMDTLPGVLTLVPTQGDIRQLRRYITPARPRTGHAWGQRLCCLYARDGVP